MSNTDNKFPFEQEITGRFTKWTGLKDPDILEALKDLTGDTYFEMRKLISLSLTKVETMVEQGEYCGFLNGKELTEEQRESIKELKEDLKEYLRLTIEATWRSILNKQKIGVDKLSISIKPFLKDGEDDNIKV